jgi:hypothetical protein
MDIPTGITANATAVSFESSGWAQNMKFHSMQEYGTTSFLYSIVGEACSAAQQPIDFMSQ